MTDFPLNDTAKAALTNASFTCPAAVRARVSASMGAKTWRYRYFGDFKELRLLRPEVGGRESSAYHVSDVYMVFGNWAMGKWNPRVTGEQERLGRYMRGAWGAFVREPERGLGAYGGVDRDGESGVRELRSEGNGQRVMKVEDGDEIVNGEGGGWPVYEEGRKTLVRLGWKNRVGANLGWPGTYDDYCSQ
jgi:carboxylesterase type B